MRLIVAIIMLLGIAAGPLARCGAADRPPAQVSKSGFSNTWLLHLPGIGGEMPIDRDLVRGLKAGGWGGPITIYDWTEHDPGLDALLARKRNEREADRVAKIIEGQLSRHPNCRITLTSHSGGTAIAVWALEKLPADCKVQTLLLLASALSPDDDLSKALAHVRGKAYAFYSRNDTLVLGVGTKLFGTMDGQRTVAAGLVGFTAPAGADAAEYQKLVQRPWVRGWMAFGNAGSHIGCMSPTFAKHVLAPLLTADLSPQRVATTQPAEAIDAGPRSIAR